MFLRLGLVCDEGGFRNSGSPSVSLKKKKKVSFHDFVLCCSRFCKNKHPESPNNNSNKRNPLWIASVTQTKLMSFSLFEYTLSARWELCSSSFPHHPASAGRDKRNLFNPALTLAEFEAHYQQTGELNLEPKWLPQVGNGGREYGC